MYNPAVIILHSNTFLLKSDLQVLLKYRHHSKLVWQNFDQINPPSITQN